ncbi:MAG: Fe(3+) ABC transporter substrate-binding protein [Campylobacterales bacterium]|nr:Fe(3+) ABC transporter substrate-binding protein [Campylobacterales bacterium]
MMRAIGFTLLFALVLEASGVVNVYSHRHYAVDKKLYKIFKKETGIKVNLIKASSAELIKRIEKEGKYTKADVLLTTDVGMIELAKSKGIFQPIKSKFLEKTVPEYLRDKDKNWFGLTKRARVIAYNIDTVSKKELSSYEALTDKKWKGKVLVTKSAEVYNQSLLSSFIVTGGEEKATNWAKGIKANMARKPAGKDKDQLRAIAAGIGDVAIVNTYYVGQMKNGRSFSDRATMEAIGVFFPNQETTGTHINISGAGIVKHSKNRENGIKFIEFLASKKAQEMFAQVNYEYPVNKEARVSDLLKSWGNFKEDKTALFKIGKENKKAVMIFNKVGWNR